MNAADEMRDALRAHLKRALRDRDRDRAAALRTGIAAIDNAEAVPMVAQDSEDGRVPDVARRALSHDEVVALLAAEVAEARQALDEVDERYEDARRRLETTVTVLSEHVDQAPGSP